MLVRSGGRETLRRNFGFTTIAVATLALGIGANTSIFVLIDAVLLQKLPVPAADKIVSIYVAWGAYRRQQRGHRLNLEHCHMRAC